MIPTRRNQILRNLGTLSTTCISDDYCNDVLVDRRYDIVLFLKDRKILLITVHLSGINTLVLLEKLHLFVVLFSV